MDYTKIVEKALSNRMVFLSYLSKGEKLSADAAAFYLFTSS